MTVELRPLTNIGVEVIGLDLGRPIDDATTSQMYRAFLDAGVLLFRGIGVSTDVQIALSRCFGELEEHALKSVQSASNKALLEVSLPGKPRFPSLHINGRIITGYLFWHQDSVYTPSLCKGGLLRMVQRPAEGGETGWIDTAKVYDALPEEMKKRIEGLEIEHCLRVYHRDVPFGMDPGIREATMEEAPYELPDLPDLPHTIYPLVSVHPETGRKSLAISPYSLVGVVGMPKAEGDELLRWLVEFTLRPEFMLIHQWANDDMVLWDNRRTIHTALGYPYGQDRIAQRTTLAGRQHSGRLAS